MGAAASIMALTGALGSSGGSAGYLDVTTTNSTTSKSETHTADGTFSTVGDVIIHDGWNQTNTAYFSGNHSQANDGTLVVSGGDITVDVEVWGAAGGSGQGSYTGYGGGGEYRKARMVLKPGTYYWMVGAGGGVPSSPANRQGSGGWGGGGSSGRYTITLTGDNGTAFAEGGDISAHNNTRNALGAGGGGLTGLFGAATPSQANALLVAGGGGGYGYIASPGSGGGAGGSNGATTSAGGNGGGGAAAGGAGYGGAGEGRGGGGGGGYWGGGGGRDATSGLSNGGGGMGFTVASDGHALVGTVSDTTTEAGNNSGAAGGSGSINFKAALATSTASTSRCGRGGRIAITIVNTSG